MPGMKPMVLESDLLDGDGPAGESCLRCGAEMEWRHETWQCPRCTFKIGCCEGEPQS